MPAQAQHCGRERWELREYPGSLVLPGQQGDGSETWCSLCLAAQLGCRRSAVVPLVWDAPAELPSGKQKVHLSSHKKKKKKISFISRDFCEHRAWFNVPRAGCELAPISSQRLQQLIPLEPGVRRSHTSAWALRPVQTGASCLSSELALFKFLRK